MNIGETIRFNCNECLVAFDVCLTGSLECGDQAIDSADVVCCPFCMSAAIKMQHDRPLLAE